MEAITKLESLYTQRDNLNQQIEQIENILGSAPGEIKTRKKRGPNKPKTAEVPGNTM
jgi:hypothetical protein